MKALSVLVLTLICIFAFTACSSSTPERKSSSKPSAKAKAKAVDPRAPDQVYLTYIKALKKLDYKKACSYLSKGGKDQFINGESGLWAPTDKPKTCEEGHKRFTTALNSLFGPSWKEKLSIKITDVHVVDNNATVSYTTSLSQNKTPSVVLMEKISGTWFILKA